MTLTRMPRPCATWRRSATRLSCIIMRFRQVTLLVAIYLALDFANPMMPGAVQLIGGCLQTVAGCQARGGEVSAPAFTKNPWELSSDVLSQALALRAGRRVVSASPPVPVLFRASLEPRTTPASSSDDD